MRSPVWLERRNVIEGKIRGNGTRSHKALTLRLKKLGEFSKREV